MANVVPTIMSASASGATASTSVSGSEGVLNRKPNFSKSEEVLLVEEYVRRKTVIEGKFSSNLTKADKKKSWAEIAEVINM